MGTLGKILLFVNFLLAAGVVYLATGDWAKRQDLAATALRYQLAVDGLPVEPRRTDDDPTPGSDEVFLPVTAPGGHPVTVVRKTLLDGYFQGSGGGAMGTGPAPASQLDEVKRAQQQAESQVAALSQDPVGRLALLTGRFTQNGFEPSWLGRLAETYEERELVRQLAATQANNAAEAGDTAKKMLDKRFAAVLAPPNPSAADADAARVKEAAAGVIEASKKARAANLAFQQNPTDNAAAKALEAALGEVTRAQTALKDVLSDAGTAASRDDGDRRLRIAHLLLHLDKDAGWQKRVALLAGLRTYAQAVADQANRLARIADATRQQVVLDQAKFSEEYELLKNLAVKRSLVLREQVALTADLVAQRARDRDLVTQRAAQLTRRIEELKQLQAEVAALLQKQAAAEAALFAAQKDVGDTLDRNFKLEADLAAAEKAKAAPGR